MCPVPLRESVELTVPLAWCFATLTGNSVVHIDTWDGAEEVSARGVVAVVDRGDDEREGAHRKHNPMYLVSS